MKKLLITLIAINLHLFLINQSFAVSYLEDIHLTNYPDIENTQSNVNWSRLIENYLVKLKNEVRNFQAINEINNDLKIISFTKKLEKMIFSLKQIQTTSVEKNTAEEVMKSIIKDLKKLNPQIKSYLKERKKLIDVENIKLKEKYNKIALNFKKELDTFISDLISKIKQNPQISNKNKIIDHILKLNNESKKLKNFNSTYFNNKKEMKSYLLGIIVSLKKEIIDIKALLK